MKKGNNFSVSNHLVIKNNNNLPAPILIFTYTRLNSFKKTIESLKLAELACESPLIIVSDGAKDISSKKIVQQVREYCINITGFKSVELIFRDSNWGIEKSFRDAQTNVLKRYSKMIMLEDDNVVHNKCLTFLNKALDFYEKDPKVFSISAYSIPEQFKTKDGYYFLPWFVPWVFATWSDKFLRFNWDEYYFKKNLSLKNGKTRLKNYGNFFYESAWLDYYRYSNAEDARVNMFLFYNNLVTVCPEKSLVKNIGNDGLGINAKSTNRFDTDLDYKVNKQFEFKNFIELDNEIIEKQKIFFDRGIFHKFLNLLYIRRLYYIFSFYFPFLKRVLNYLTSLFRTKINIFTIT